VDSRFRGNDQRGLVFRRVTGEKPGEGTGPGTLPFLIEVGCEEIPARFLRDAEKSLGERIQAALSEARLLHEVPVGAVRDPSPEGYGPQGEPPLRTYSTPRRLVVHVPALLAQQADKVEEILGPPVKVAVDAEGKYTRAAESFAQKNSARLEDLVRATKPKGEYLALRKTIQGRSAQAILPEILPAAILGLSFPKSMYWTEKVAPRFVRPIRWVLALLGEGKQATTVEFEILGVRSGDFTFGHRAKSRAPQRVIGFKDYVKRLEQEHVEIDPTRRRKRASEETQALVENASLKLVQDDWLLDWVVNSTEWPRPMLGSFDARFLHLPREILTTVMRDHQKYFAVEQVGPSGARPSGQDQLAPHFVAVLNMDSDEKGLIRQGHERVLTARFRDAEFFWKTDLKTTLFERIPLLDGITYQAGLGTYAEKVSRMKTIASGLCERLEACPVPFVPWHYGGSPGGFSKQPVKVRFTQEHTRSILRAIDLCKCDLTTQMVQEFPELQGIVGGLYLGAQPLPESPEVAEAIYDHYRPAGADDICPRSIVGAVVSLVDKLDSVVAGFAAGHRPTGSSDPFAIRRQANGIIKVLLEFSVPIDLDCEITGASNTLLCGGLNFDLRQVLDAVKEFMRERLTYYLESVIGLRYDTVRAAMGAHYWLIFEPLQVMARARAVEKIRSSDDFVSLSQSAKRIRNILEKSAKSSDYQGGNLDPQRLEAGPERSLYEAYERVRNRAAQKREEGNIYGALETIALLRSPLDAFFDNVLVMAEDPGVRRNRLQLLLTLDRLFTEDADLSKIERPNVDASTSGRNEPRG
jgi:glycyl-tRNA synthetase beta chain